ncbi:MAG: branched-chain amino acid ABC transporter permease [Defluviitaleaceae bacterium]|nr:branched-chain amino acid ABC transporter permease [Defluviitaleaceae bacterium]MCL2239595.1 branched-chain amino acid ABC transporter permease [Defluviitaleaceae bacterium]
MIMNKLANMDRLRWIELVLLAVAFIVLLIIPQISGAATITMVSRIMIFAVFAMAYDILRGFIGVIHLGFALFIGGGAYFVGILFFHQGATIPMLLLAVVGTTIYSAIWALIVGKISGKSGMLATAMITMAFSEIMRNLMTVWRTVTRGEDGIAFRVPAPFNDRTMMFYACFIFMILMAFVLYKFTKSPTGRVWQAVRENEQRAIFLGYNTARARTIALLVASIVGGLAGVMFGLNSRFVNTEALGMQMTYDAMLYSLLGGAGTLFGAILGSTVVILFQNFLLDLRPIHAIFERWLLFFGALYIVVVMFMPHGIMGYYNAWKEKRAQKKRMAKEAASS